MKDASTILMELAIILWVFGFATIIFDTIFLTFRPTPIRVFLIYFGTFGGCLCALLSIILAVIHIL